MANQGKWLLYAIVTYNKLLLGKYVDCVEE